MTTFLAAFLIATLIAAALTPLVRLWAIRIGAVSAPGGRHLNARSIPRLGGIAIFAAFTLPLLGLFATESSVAVAVRADAGRVAGLLFGALLMTSVGFLDDTRRVRALYKLYAQIAAASIAWMAGFRINVIELPLVGLIDLGPLALPVTLAWIVGITNAINLIDGLDGLAAGVVFFAAFTNLVVAHVSGAWFVSLLMAAMLGSVLGFLFHNFNPARIYMGDSGSYFLGFVLATTSLAGAQKASTTVSLLVPILALGLPIFDTLFAMVRRFLERRPLFSPDRGHVHHRLLDMGLTQRRAVLLLYGVSLLFTVAAILSSFGRSFAIGGLLILLSIAVTGIVRFAASFQQTFNQRRQRSRLRTHHAELLRHLLPEVPALMMRVDSEEAFLHTLHDVGKRAGLCAIEILDSPLHHEGKSVVVVRIPTNGDMANPEALRARYPIGSDARAVASLRFTWIADQAADVSAQEEVLLQIIVDICAQKLARLGSPYAEPERTDVVRVPTTSLAHPTTAH